MSLMSRIWRSASLKRACGTRSVSVALRCSPLPDCASEITSPPRPMAIDWTRSEIDHGSFAFSETFALILTANVSLKAKDPWSISDRVQSIAIGLGGDVISLAQSGSGEQRSATLTLRVPQARFSDALRQIRDISDIEVVASNVDGKDVTDQFVDLQARLTAKKAEEARYLALLARADKIEDILKIDAVLSQVRTQI